MTELITVAFHGSKSVLETDFSPEIMLDENHVYSCVLLDLIINNCQELEELVALNVLRIHCDLISNSYINGRQSHTIHQFAISASHVKDRTLVEIPKNLNYFSVTVNRLQTIRITITDKSGKPVTIKSGDIYCRINIKREQLK